MSVSTVIIHDCTLTNQTESVFTKLNSIQILVVSFVSHHMCLDRSVFGATFVKRDPLHDGETLTEIGETMRHAFLIITTTSSNSVDYLLQNYCHVPPPAFIMLQKVSTIDVGS
jgi:hypothetical protein